MNQDVRIAVIVGSVRAGRFAPTVSNWFVSFAASRPGVIVDTIDLAEFDLANSFESSPDLTALAERLELADAFVIVTPEYNHSFPGYLKTAIDSTDKEFGGKPVGFVAYGGMSGGLRAVEALRVVMAEVHAVTIRETVSFHGARAQFNEAGQPVDPERVDQAANRMLDQLIWWAEAARSRRSIQAYPG